MINVTTDPTESIERIVNQRMHVLAAIPANSLASTSDIARLADLPRSRAYRALLALHKAGLVIRTYDCLNDHCCGMERGLYPHWGVLERPQDA